MGTNILDSLNDTKRFLTTFKVSRLSFTKAMDLIGLVLRGTQMGKVFALEYKDGKLIARASAALYVTVEIDVIEPPEEDFEVVCAYSDNTALIGKQKELELTVSSEYMTAYTTMSEVSYRTSVAKISRVKGEDTPTIVFDSASLVSGIKTLTSMSNIIKSHPTFAAISLDGDIAQMRTPTIWVETKSSLLNMVLSLDIARVLSSFIGSSYDKVAVKQSLNYIQVLNGKSVLFIPKQDESNIKPLKEEAKDYLFAGKFSITESYDKIKDIMKSTGKMDARVSLSEHGLRIISESNEAMINLKLGDFKNPFVTFNIRLEFLINVLTVLGTQFEVKSRGHLLYFQGLSNSVIIATA